MPTGLNKSRDELPWLYYPRSNSVRVINSHLEGGGGGSDPESGLSLTTSIPTGGIAGSNAVISQSNSAVFAAEMTIPVSPSGLIFELGRDTVGSYVGFRPSGAFVIRAGNGAVSAPTSSANDMPVLYLTSGQPSGTGTLVWEVNASLAQLRAWWNGTLLGTATASNNSFPTGLWAGANGGAYFSTSLGTAIPVGENGNALAATDVSDLRHYDNQLSSL